MKARLRPAESSTQTVQSTQLPPIRFANVREARILDFDIETRRVGFFTSGKFAPDGCEPIAIAVSWLDKTKVEVKHLGECDSEEMLSWFAGYYDEADIVTGHYIRKFDLPILNGAMFEHSLPRLSAKMTSDTQQDLPRRAGISASQENLGAMFGLRESKVAISDHTWRGGARLDPVALEKIRERVVADVRQHKALRKRLIDQGALKTPRIWRP